jgi:hypothetical protein
MKKTVILSLFSFATLLAVQTINGQTIADWTFETSQPGVITLPAAPGAGVAFTSFSPEVGSGTATALHAGAATYSSPAGNGSARSFSVNTWAVGDFFQFQVSTLTYSGISVSYDQTSSSSGPGQFNLQYSTDGSTFTTFGSQYNVLVNAAPNTWSAGTPVLTTSFSANLSSITALNNAPTVYFRILDATALSASQANGGSTVPSAAGTDRIDNFLVSATPVPEPSTLALAAFGGVAALIAIRKRR